MSRMLARVRCMPRNVVACRVSQSVVACVTAVLVLAAAACAPVAPRFPADVQTAIAHDDMRKLVTDQFIIYYPAHRRAQVDRFLARADGCARTLREHAITKRSTKIVIVMPEAPFNNAFVAPDALGFEQISVVPTYATLDFATAFGLPPDPSMISCHELVHYVQFQQTSGFWGVWNRLFGPMYTPQLGYDPWFDEGLATHYEARLTPGQGRPAWPIFSGMFAAAYAGTDISSGELSSFGRSAPVGHHYLVGSMFVRFLAERYGERPLWMTIDNQSHAFTGWFFTGTFSHGFSVSFGDLFDQFSRWVNQTFPVRPRPPAQRRLTKVGNDARYARSRSGVEAWVAEDVDSPPRITIRDASGATLLDRRLVEILPLRKLAIADPLLTSGLSITADGNEVWFTAIDLSATFQVTRLMRWRRGDGLREITRDLGPGATIDPTGSTYYYCEVDGDRWSLAAYDVRSGARRMVIDMKPGTYVVGAQISPDGTKLAASVWDGTAFVIWILDAQTGAIAQRITGADHPGSTGAPAAGTPVFDASFTADGRLMYLGVVDGRFQAFVDHVQATDAPYAVLAAREAGTTIRFLDREGWNWELAEVALPPKPVPPPPPPAAPPAAPPEQTPPDQSAAPDAAAVPAPDAAPLPGAAPGAVAAPAPAPAPGAAPAPAASPAGAPPTPQPTWVTAPTPPPTTNPPSAAAGVSTTPPTLYPSTPLQLPAPGTVPVHSDEPYSMFDHLFFPQVRSPTITFGGGPPHYGLVLGGADRLELQRWMLAGYVQPRGGDRPLHWGGSAGYVNNMLAPVFFYGQGGFLDWSATLTSELDPDVTYEQERRTRDAFGLIGYTYRGTLTGTLGGLYTDDIVWYDMDPALHRHVAGPNASLTWYSVESTRYTGPRRALLVAGEAAYYPHQWSSFMGNITDVAGTAGFTLPLPFGRRHTISAFARARSLIAKQDTGLLQVGGDGAWAWHRSNKMEPAEYDDARFPPHLRFVEPLRGFEDFPLTSDRVKIGELSWKYPLIIDRGVAHVWFLPAAYLRQLDLGLFPTAAIVDANDRHHAVGATLTLRFQFLRIPFAVTYQLARRTSDDEALTHMVVIEPDS